MCLTSADQSILPRVVGKSSNKTRNSPGCPSMIARRGIRTQVRSGGTAAPGQQGPRVAVSATSPCCSGAQYSKKRLNQKAMGGLRCARQSDERVVSASWSLKTTHRYQYRSIPETRHWHGCVGLRAQAPALDEPFPEGALACNAVPVLSQLAARPRAQKVCRFRRPVRAAA